jgi:hypothetical protein
MKFGRAKVFFSPLSGIKCFPDTQDRGFPPTLLIYDDADVILPEIKTARTPFKHLSLSASARKMSDNCRKRNHSFDPRKEKETTKHNPEGMVRSASWRGGGEGKGLGRVVAAEECLT